MPVIMFRKQAESLGLKRYFTGIPCRNGHLSERRSSNGVCIECDDREAHVPRDPSKQRYVDKTEEERRQYSSEKGVECYERNLAKRRQYGREYYRNHREQVAEKYRQDRALLLAAREILRPHGREK